MLPATRREVFRTSVITAIGVAAGAVAGYEIAEHRGKRKTTSNPPDAGSVVAVYGQTTLNGNTTQLWYFFAFDDSDSTVCVLSNAPTGTTFPSIGPASSAGPMPYNAVDARSWYLSLKMKSQLTTVASVSNFEIKYDISSSPKSIFVTTDSYGKLTSLDSLLSAIHNDMNQIPGSWNEIGRQSS